MKANSVENYFVVIKITRSYTLRRLVRLDKQFETTLPAPSNIYSLSYSLLTSQLQFLKLKVAFLGATQLYVH